MMRSQESWMIPHMSNHLICFCLWDSLVASKLQKPHVPECMRVSSVAYLLVSFVCSESTFNFNFFDH